MRIPRKLRTGSSITVDLSAAQQLASGCGGTSYLEAPQPSDWFMELRGKQHQHGDMLVDRLQVTRPAAEDVYLFGANRSVPFLESLLWLSFWGGRSLAPYLPLA